MRKKIRRRLIASEFQHSGLKKDRFQKFSEFRYIPEAFAAVTSTNIFRNTVAIFVWAAEPIAIVVESPEVAESYRHYFAALWKAATK